MKIKFIVVGALFAASTHAQVETNVLPDVVKLQGPYNATMTKIHASDVHLYVPSDGIGTITITGTDTFDTVESSSPRLSGAIHESGKTILINNDMHAGHTNTIGLVTRCGKGISVTLHSLDGNQTKPEDIKPKLLITEANCED